MLESFFDIRKDSRKLFDGLEISRQPELCAKWMNQIPTIFISFRRVDGLNFHAAYEMLKRVITELFNRHVYLADSESTTEFERTAFLNIANRCCEEVHWVVS